MNADKLIRFIITLAISLALAAPATSIALAEAPPNDNIANATVIEGLPFEAAYDLTEATAESDDPVTTCDWYGPQQTVWFIYSPTQDVTLEASLPDRSYMVTLSVFTIQDGTLQQMACGGHSNFPIYLHAISGQTYYFMINYDYDWYDYLTGTFILKALNPPSNDDLLNPTLIETLPFSEWVDLADATPGAGDRGECTYNGNISKTVWYEFTPSETMILEAGIHEAPYGVVLSAYSGIPEDLKFINCQSYYQQPFRFSASPSQTYYIQIGIDSDSGYPGSGPIRGEFTLADVPPPENDTFLTAKPFNLGDGEWIDLSSASLEPDEPLPTCQPGIQTSVWYQYTASTSGAISFHFPQYEIDAFAAIYTGDSLSELEQLDCMGYEYMGTILAEAGETYYIQVGTVERRPSRVFFELIQTPPPYLWEYWFTPGDPSIYDTVNFCADVWDPGEIGIEKKIWGFGDGNEASTTEYCVSHKYATDGDYTISFLATTFDGRSVARSDLLLVRTHDVAVIKIAAPKSASVGQTRTITVNIKNIRYPERVQIELFKSIPGSFELVGVAAHNIPVRGGNRTTAVTFSYTFVQGDADIGKVTFKAVATIIDARDALPADNEAISPPTKVQ